MIAPKMWFAVLNYSNADALSDDDTIIYTIIQLHELQ